MKKNFLTGIISGVAIITICAIAVLANPGGEDNPLISKSYLDNVFMGQVQQYINDKASFRVVELQAGQRLVGKSGCELILRQGTAKIFSTEKGGIADTTTGTDLANGTAMPANHLLIVPVDDGRGVSASDKVLVMVKGEYEVE